MAEAAAAFLKSLAIEPPVKPGAPDPYTPPKPGQLKPEEYLQIGPITQFVTELRYPDGDGGAPHDVRQHQPDHGLTHASGA
jgi:arylsulfatase